MTFPEPADSMSLDQLLSTVGTSLAMISADPMAVIDRIVKETNSMSGPSILSDLGTIESRILRSCDGLPTYRAVGSLLLAEGEVLTQAELDAKFQKVASYRERTRSYSIR
ncbi:MAG: hypothetical protein IT432_14985 [Phycisphaerales bacterium]|nr:hypothetical protein [Phycisphaerales bacterium]